jgi:hypothetical protein
MSPPCATEWSVRDSEEGRTIMMNDLRSIHETVIEAYKALMLLSGIDLDALAEKINKSQTDSAIGDSPTLLHLPI